MPRKYLIALSAFFSLQLSAQLEPEFEAQPVGGKEQLEQVLQTQLTLPKTLFSPGFDAHVIALFDLDSAGNAIHVTIEKTINNALRNELKRILRFIHFKRTQSLLRDNMDEVDPYHHVFHVSIDKYNRYFKQKSKFSPKKGLMADSSYVIYTRADRSPEYYKNGEEGLEEFLLSEIEYPGVAKEKSIEGTVIVEFVVETNGFVTGLKINKGVNGGCSEEALRLIKETRWQPAQLNSKLVRYRTTYPITFSLRNLNGMQSSSTVGQ